MDDFAACQQRSAEELLAGFNRSDSNPNSTGLMISQSEALSSSASTPAPQSPPIGLPQPAPYQPHVEPDQEESEENTDEEDEDDEDNEEEE